LEQIAASFAGRLVRVLHEAVPVVDRRRFQGYPYPGMTTPDDEPIRIIDDLTPPEKRLGPAWKILVVDDSQSVLDLSDMVLADVVFDRRPLAMYYATSAAEAKRVLAEHGHESFAVALIDVVMEDETAGLRLVEHIRTTLGNHTMRLILRTGQPGFAPEESVILQYDINDYRNKTDLRAQQLVTLVIAALRGHRDLLALAEERKRAERLAVEAQSLSKAKSEFLLLLSHEMRTPLEGILGNADLLADEVPDTLRQPVADIRLSGQRMLRVVEDLLDTAALQTGTWQVHTGVVRPAAMLQSIATAVAPFAHERAITVTTAVDAQVPPVLVGDDRSLERALFLLTDNAVKFSARGTVELTVEVSGAVADPQRLRFCVKDRGPGLPADRERLLQPFALGDASLRRRHGGLGLGLAIVKGITDRLCGTLVLSDRDGGGTVASIELALPRS
jgi:signal transduction histidine kinase